jgi:Predicted membrane protein
LARRGYLKIEERKKGEFWLVKTEKEETDLLPFEKILLDEFFNGKTEINLEKEELYNQVEKVKEAIYKQVVAASLFPQNPNEVRSIYDVFLALSIFTVNFLLFFSSLIFGPRMPRKTKAGVEAKNIAFSLRNFLKSQERQLKFQADKQLLFEKLLPYAIVFGVEKIWAKRFEDLGITQPSWYQSYSAGRSFNSVYFVNSLNSSISSFRSSATPTRSSSGFSSGFSSGGGFSGGGGGGGGGGSW